MFLFKIQAGEISLYQKLVDGFIWQPNIFTDTPVGPSDLPQKFEPSMNPPGLAVSTPCLEATKLGVKLANKKIIYTFSKFSRMYVDVSGDYQDYIDGFSKSSLGNLQRKNRKVDKSNQTEPSLRVYTEAADVADFIAIAKSISEVSYQELRLGTVFPTDSDWRQKLEKLAEKNCFRGYVLYVEDKPVAYNYCPVYGDGIMLYDLSGYRPEYQKYSPGTVLQFHVIKDAFSNPSANKYDLCTGGGRHKEQFSTGSIECCSSYIFPAVPYYWVLVLAHFAIESTSNRLVALLDRFGLKNKIKTYLRRR